MIGMLLKRLLFRYFIHIKSGLFVLNHSFLGVESSDYLTAEKALKKTEYFYQSFTQKD